MMLKIDKIIIRENDEFTRDRIYVEVDDKVFNSLPREEQILQLNEVMPAVLKMLGMKGDAVFSQKAGCDCGCSPGFIVEASHRRIDVWVDFTSKEKTS